MKKILIIQKKRIGDVLTSTILLEALKEKYPSSELHYLIYPNSFAVVDKNPFYDKLIILDEETRKKSFKFLSFLFKIRKEKYDIVVDAYGKPNSVLIGWLSGAKIKITFNKLYSKLLYTHSLERNKISFSNATTAIEHRMLLLKPLGIDFKIYKPKIVLSESEKNDAKEYLIQNNIDINKPIIMISAVGSRDFKTYPLHYMAKVLDYICQNTNAQLLFNYMPDQKPIAEEIYNLSNPETQKNIFLDVYQNDIRKFLALTSLCEALIGNEGGATNMAKALDIPTFTIFAPSVPKQDWNMFENETTNISVHLHDFLPEEQAYEKFEPTLFTNQLKAFLIHNCTK
ncbi:glycosyltransferase family 9 protein [Flavobacterium sp. NG2]|uniref:glycosyltransferase family 9 protein n=1 Tax=Flavobacterium sp. NG2 TaxID=3097547 RepID=UPI002A80E56E|nr:glycosyltransferase family 9 protein [Flavobacterium sp. NG2]WPR72908.1 glycosyltransferase family 9 protein [Flavobacterium sp. NG2]